MSLSIGPCFDFKTTDVVYNEDITKEIRNFLSTFQLSVHLMEGFKNSFVLKICYDDSIENHRSKFPGGGFGQCLYSDYGHAAKEIADEYCLNNGYDIDPTVVKHYPMLQYLIRKS